MTNLLLLLLAILLVFCNAFFVAAEFGMVKLRHTRIAAIKKKYGLRGKILAHVHKHLDSYLSACQLGITLASLGLGWIGEPAFAHILEPFFKFVGIDSQELIIFIAFFVAFSIISFLHIVIGELVPKSLALRQSEMVSLWTAVPLFAFYWSMYPAIWLLNFCANSILKIAKLDVIHIAEYTYSPDEIKLILSTTHVHDQLSRQEIEILRHSIELLDLEAIDVMRPIEEMIALKADDSINSILNFILEHRYSRYPIFHEKNKEFIGIVHVKDILRVLSQQNGNQELKSIMRPVLKVSRHLSAIKLLNKLQEGMPHFALVYSGRETPIGFVTLDNIFQVIVGRVRDEFHKIDESWVIAPDGAFLMSGNRPLYVLERALNIDVELDEETEKTSDTIFGFILTILGRLPHEGEKIELKNFSMVVKKMKGHQIIEVAVYPKEENANQLQ
jgi:CBS domain containing-hemolysin-like protein